MDCKKTQRLINELGDGRIKKSEARAIQQHLGECSDCRVTQQRSLRLQQLLSVKRHENPGADYFDNFLGEFQQRLAKETAPRPSLWERFCGHLHIQPVFSMRYGFAHALGVVLAIAGVWRGLSAGDFSANSNQAAALDLSAPRLVSSTQPASHSTPRKIVSALPTPHAKAAVVPSGALVIPESVRDDFTSPGYALDQFAAAPAYEVASIHF